MEDQTFKHHFQLMIQCYEDDRDANNRKFILVKEMVKGQDLYGRMKDISQIELACMIRNYASALHSLGEYTPFRETMFTNKNVIFKGDYGL